MLLLPHGESLKPSKRAAGGTASQQLSRQAPHFHPWTAQALQTHDGTLLGPAADVNQIARGTRLRAAPVPGAQGSINDRRWQRAVQKGRRSKDPVPDSPDQRAPAIAGNAPPLEDDAAVFHAVAACSTWREVASLTASLAARQSPADVAVTRRKQRTVHAAAPLHDLPLPALHPPHAVLLLTRLAQLHPSPTVWASVVMQPSVPGGEGSAPEPAVTPAGAATAGSSVPLIGNEPAAGAIDGSGSMAGLGGEAVQGSGASANPPGPSDSSDAVTERWGVGELLHVGAPLLPNGASSNAAGLLGASALLLQAPVRPSRLATPPGASRQPARPGKQGPRGAAGLPHAPTPVPEPVRQLADDLVAGLSTPAALARISAVDAAALLSALAKLGYIRCPLAPQVTARLAAGGGLVALRALPDALAHVGWAVAKLQHDPGPQWISHYLHVTSDVLPYFTAVDCAAVSWALGRWGFKPADPWLHALYQRLREVGPQLGPQGVTNVAWALAMLKVEPPRDVAELLMIESQVALPSMTGAGLATLCWALASMRQLPPDFWLDEALQAMRKTMAAIPRSARGLPFANMVWALCMWQPSARPSPAWLTDFTRHCARSLPSMSPRSVAVVVSGLADLDHHPSPAWVSLALEEFHKRLTDAAPGSIVAVLWATSRLLRPKLTAGGENGRSGGAVAAWRPPRPWSLRYAHVLQDLAEAVAAGFGALTANELLDCLVALSNLRHHPGSAWLATHAAFCNVVFAEFSDVQLALLRNARAALAGVREVDLLPKKGEVV